MWRDGKLVIYRKPRDMPANIDQLRDEQVLQWGFQQLRFEGHIKREEKRQLAIKQFGLDPVQATIQLHKKKGLL